MEIGEVFLISALVFSAVAIVAFVAGLRRQKLLKIAAKALYGYAAMLTHAFFLLLYYFLTRDFSVKYVFEHSDAYLPLLYTISAVWAGKEGSLLLWAWFVALLNVAFFRIEKRKRGETDRVTATSLAISSSIVLFFSVLLVTTSNPFSRLDFTPVHGMGLNPMLRTLEMALHPLAIFVGYAAVTLPFACNLWSPLQGKLDKKSAKLAAVCMDLPINRNIPWCMVGVQNPRLGRVLGMGSR